MLRAGREPGAAEADLRELGVSNRIIHTKVVGKWMNLVDDFDYPLRTEYSNSYIIL